MLNEEVPTTQGFDTICKVELPFKEILTAIQPKYFSEPLIKPCYLVLTYADETLNSPYKYEN